PLVAPAGERARSEDRTRPGALLRTDGGTGDAVRPLRRLLGRYGGRRNSPGRRGAGPLSAAHAPRHGLPGPAHRGAGPRALVAANPGFLRQLEPLPQPGTLPLWGGAPQRPGLDAPSGGRRSDRLPRSHAGAG